MVKYCVRHGMIVDKINEIISSKKSMWLEINIIFNTQKRNKAKNEMKKDFNKLLYIPFYGKTMEKVRNRIGLKIIKKDDTENFIKQQPKLTFNGIHKLYENCNS